MGFFTASIELGCLGPTNIRTFSDLQNVTYCERDIKRPNGDLRKFSTYTTSHRLYFIYFTYIVLKNIRKSACHIMSYLLHILI